MYLVFPGSVSECSAEEVFLERVHLLDEIKSRQPYHCSSHLSLFLYFQIVSVCEIKVCEQTWATPSVVERCREGGMDGKGREPQGRRGRSETGHLSKRSMSSFSPHLERDLSKSYCKQLRVWGFFWGGGRAWEGDLTFSSLWKRMYYSWETKDLTVSMPWI